MPVTARYSLQTKLLWGSPGAGFILARSAQGLGWGGNRQQNPGRLRRAWLEADRGVLGQRGVSAVSQGAARRWPARNQLKDGSCWARRGDVPGHLAIRGSLPALLTRGPLRPTEASLGAAGASREEAELRAPAVPVPAGSACLLPLHPRALRALPGPLPLSAPEENASKGFSCPTTWVSWESFRLVSAQSCVCPDATQLVRGPRCSGAQTAVPKGLLPPTYLQRQSQLAAELLSCDEGRAHAYKSAVL